MRDDNDQYTWAAIVSSADNHYASLVDAAIAGSDRTPTPLLEALFAIGVDRRDDLARLLERYIDTGEPRVENLRIVSRWLDVLSARNLAWGDVRDRADDRLAKTLKRADSMFAAARGVAGDTQRELAMRSAAIGLLGRDVSHYPMDIALLARMLTPQTLRRLQLAAIERLSGIPDADAGLAILSNWSQLLPEVQIAGTDMLLSRTQWTSQLMDHLQQGTLSAVDIQLTHQNRLLGSRDEKIAAAAREVFGQDIYSNRGDILAEYKTALSLIGNVDRGAVVFKDNCQNCHNLDTDQVPVGPDLRSLTDRSSAALLTAILDPSRSIEPRYLSYNIELRTGEILDGVVVREDSNSITVANADGTRRAVLRDAIDAIERSNVSIMPVGFETKMKPRDVADVIAFVNQLGR
jgi:putative heme-binding domain-containing protein